MHPCRLLPVLLFVPGLLASGIDRHVPQSSAPAGSAPLLDNLGNHHHPITTKSKPAQRYFDQGLILLYGFNHPEAIRSFQEVARLDPDCAMAHWGVALAYGPNINAPMSDDAVPRAYAALQQALKLAPKASAREQAYIQALARRYGAKPGNDRAELDRAYADAMRELARRYPDDLDAQTLFAEALMNLTPWNYWTEDGQPQAATREILDALEAVLRRNPDHAGACHYYIHAVEASPNPERALGAAHRLRDLVPGAGHLVHMPSHIYIRVGNYHEAALCNERAIAVDEAYITRYKVQGAYPTMYYVHNIHFLWYATTMEGRSKDAIRAGRKTAAVLRKMDLEHHPEMRAVLAVPYFALARFGKWDEILAEPEPEICDYYERIMWHHVRGLAFVRQRKAKEAEAELAALEKLAGRKEVAAMDAPVFPAAALVKIAQTLLAAEISGLAGRTGPMLEQLEAAVGLQDKLPYMEPPHWHCSTRLSLGSALLRLGQVEKAEAVYRADLKRNPDNGWALFGLLQSLRAQGRTTEAAETERRFREAWKHADVTLTGSGF